MISVVICTHNRASSLCRALESIRQMCVPRGFEWELLIIDNGSSDDTQQQVNKFALISGLNIRYIWEPRIGKSNALNRGVSEARGEIIAFTDDDVQVSECWLSELVCTFNQFNCLGVGGRSIPAWDGLTKPDWLVTAGPYCLSRGPLLDFDKGEEAKEIQVAPWGLNAAYKKIAFQKYGGFRTDLGPSGPGYELGEDTEFGRRLLRHGEKIAYAPKAIVHHPVHPQRISKRYFLQYQYKVGRTEMLLEGYPAETLLHFGIPRYMFRAILEKCANWMFTLGSEKRFYNKGQMYLLLGQMMEARSSHRKNKSMTGLRGSQRAY